MPFVTALERARSRRFLHAMDAARHLVGRALARRMLCAAAGLTHIGDFTRTSLGKPVCPQETHAGPGHIDFSITHSGAMVWTAFCRGASVGIDVEQVRPLPDIFELAAQLHPLECAAVRARPDAERAAAFYRCWTRKESVLKALGMGLHLPLHDFQVRPQPPASDWLISLPDGMARELAAAPSAGHSGAACPAWTTRDIGLPPGYQCSVAANAPHLSLAVFFAGDGDGADVA